MKIITPIRAKNRHELLFLIEKTKNRADVLEIWLDELTWMAGFAGDIKKIAPKAQLLGVCKTSPEQGTFSKDGDKKLQILLNFLEHGGTWVDLDIGKNELKTVKQIPSEKLWLSLHDFERCPMDLQKKLEMMQFFNPFGVKFAVTPKTPMEMQYLMDFARNMPYRTKGIFTTMGEKYGKSGRTQIQEHNLSWGGFYGINTQSVTANGQMTLDDLET